MPEFSQFPIALALVGLFAVAVLRGQATYWIARSVTEQTLRHTHPTSGWRAAVHRWLFSDAMDRGRGAVERCGVVAIPLCYLTVGLQTVVLASAGVLRMRWLRFTLAQAPGAAAWAVIYATIGFTVWEALFAAAFAGGPGAVVALAIVLALGGAVVHRVLAQRRRTSVPASNEALASSEATAVEQ